jgi:hypothetical protein
VADPPAGAGCKGLVNAVKKSGNEQVEENAVEHGCLKKEEKKEEVPPEAKAGDVV